MEDRTRRAGRTRPGWTITVCHFPPGTSKWNKIEHRLFSHITLQLARLGRWPATTSSSSTIAATTTATGLTVSADLDDGRYPAGVKVSDDQMDDLEDRAHHPPRLPRRVELRPRSPCRARPAPRTARPPGPPSRDLDALIEPALNGMTGDDLAALAAATGTSVRPTPRISVCSTWPRLWQGPGLPGERLASAPVATGRAGSVIQLDQEPT